MQRNSRWELNHKLNSIRKENNRRFFQVHNLPYSKHTDAERGLQDGIEIQQTCTSGIGEFWLLHITLSVHVAIR